MNNYEIIKLDIKNTIRTYISYKLIQNPSESERCYKENCICSRRSESGIDKNVNYVKNYLNQLNDRNYLFQFLDNSLIQANYEFKIDGKDSFVSKANLVFYPNPGLYDTDTLIELKDLNQDFEDCEDYIDTLRIYLEDIKEDFTYRSNYIRLDFSSNDDDFTEFTHPRCHMHIGLNNEFRIGVNLLPKLSSFVDFVMYVNYNEDWQKLNGSTAPEIIGSIFKRKLERIALNEELSEVEKSNYHFNFGI